MRWILLASTMAFLATAAKAEPFVVFQSLHNLNYARGACEFVQSGLRAMYLTSKAKAQCASQSDPRTLGRRLELAVQSKLAMNLHCAGVTAIHGWEQKYDGGTGNEYLAAQRQEHWDLLLDFEPGGKKHHWSIFRSNGFGSLNENVYGEGTPAEIAEAVCIIVTGKGATIR